MPTDSPFSEVRESDSLRLDFPEGPAAGSRRDGPTQHMAQGEGTPGGDDQPSGHTIVSGGTPQGPEFPFLLPPVEASEIGRLGNYRVLGLLGRGGMGLIFRAEDIALRRPVALKVMKPDLGAHPEGWRRFLREARIMASIKHEHLVTVYQVAQENNVVFLAMELLEGQLLEDWARKVAPARAPDILRIGREIAAGLVVIHQRGLIHRDIKPTNLWLEAPGERVKILDFGLVHESGDGTPLTQPGAVLGTPDFMSPEQARGDQVDARADLFSLGAVLYRLCTGKQPFYADNLMGVLTALAVSDPPPVHEVNPAIPWVLSDLVMRLLSKDRAARPESAAAVLEELQRIEADPADPAVTARLGALAPISAVADKGKSATPRSKDVLVVDKRWVFAVLGIALVAILLLFVARFGFGPAPVVNATTPASTPVEPPRFYLSEMERTGSQFYPFQPPPDAPNFDMRVRFKGKESPHGLFMHPPPPMEGAASVSYNLGKQYATFHATVTQNDGLPQSDANVTFRVFGDSKLLWKSQPLNSQEGTQDCDVSVKGVEVLTLEVRADGEPRAAHAVWLEPYVAK
jgi:serine/threonine protein kinase